MTRTERAARSSYVIACTYRDDASALRGAAMAEHLAYLRANRHRLRFAGPLLDEGGAPSGSLCIVDVSDRYEALDFIQREAFCRAGMFEDIDIIRFKTAIGRAQADYRPSPRRRLYVCRWLAAPGADRPFRGCLHPFERVETVELLERGALISDDGTRVIGGLLIVEVDDPSQALQVLIQDVDPSMAEGARKQLMHWRFGQALSGVGT